MENTAVIRQSRRTHRPFAGCSRGSAQPFKERTRRDDGDGFLKHAFQPVWLYEGERSTMEREFINSLSNLCSYFEITEPEMSATQFPQNIYNAWQEVVKELERRDKEVTCMIVADENVQAALAVTKPYGLSYDLFYIPVRTFWKWANTAERQAITDLVKVLFAYLHQVVQVPFYQQSGSFMDNQYESIEQWLMEAEEDDDEESKAYREHQEDTLYELRQAGAHILPLIQNPACLDEMQGVIVNYKPQDKAETEFADLAHEFLKLYEDYPKATIFENTRADILYNEEDDRVAPDQYTGFFWSTKDCLVDQLDDMITCAFQEIPFLDEPVKFMLFNNMPAKDTFIFDFETRLFSLMEGLRDLLNEHDHEEHNGTI